MWANRVPLVDRSGLIEHVCHERLILSDRAQNVVLLPELREQVNLHLKENSG